jgi:hypothetical protein
VGQGGLAQEELGLGVEQDAAAPDQQEVEILDQWHQFVAGQVARGHCTLDAMASLGIRGIPGEHRDIRRNRIPELRDHALQDRLVTQVEAAVGADDPDPVAALPRPSHGPLRLFDCGWSRVAGVLSYL